VPGQQNANRQWTAWTLLFAWGIAALFSGNARAAEEQAHPLLVAYFPQWGIYNQPQYFVKDMERSGAAGLLDQVDYAQAAVGGGKCSLADPKADLNYTFSAKNSVDGHADHPASPFRGNFHQLEELKQKYPRLKLLISLEGSAAFFAADAQPQKREAFVASCVDLFLKGHLAPHVTKPGLFDGFDVDWEYPRSADAANYVALLREFRRQLDAYRPGLRLTVAVGPSPHMYPDVDMAAAGATVDEVGVMNYDYAGPWSKTTGMLAPLYKDTADPRDGGSVDGSLAQYRAAGIPAGKLLMGLPFYGYGWQRVTPANHGLFQRGQAIQGDQPYRYVAGLMKSSKVYRDPVNQAPWIFNGREFWTYEDAVSIAFKADYAKQQKLGGVMVWELSGDSADGSLLRAAARELNTPKITVSAKTN
jgi:chitinase